MTGTSSERHWKSSSSMFIEKGPSRAANDGVAVMSRIVHEIGDRPYNEGLAMAASALHMR